MPKKCIICGNEAEFSIKDSSSDFYCKGCAEENFEELSYLERL